MTPHYVPRDVQYSSIKAAIDASRTLLSLCHQRASSRETTIMSISLDYGIPNHHTNTCPLQMLLPPPLPGNWCSEYLGKSQQSCTILLQAPRLLSKCQNPYSAHYHCSTLPRYFVDSKVRSYEFLVNSAVCRRAKVCG